MPADDDSRMDDWLVRLKEKEEFLYCLLHIVTRESNRFFSSFIVVVDRMQVNRIMNYELGLKNLQVHILLVFCVNWVVEFMDLQERKWKR